jgi:hypothetical protein
MLWINKTVSKKKLAKSKKGWGMNNIEIQCICE